MLKWVFMSMQSMLLCAVLSGHSGLEWHTLLLMLCLWIAVAILSGSIVLRIFIYGVPVLAQDVFSMGCVIAELFMEGRAHLRPVKGEDCWLQYCISCQHSKVGILVLTAAFCPLRAAAVIQARRVRPLK